MNVIVRNSLTSLNAIILEHIEPDSTECANDPDSESLRFRIQVPHQLFIQIKDCFQMEIWHQ